MTVSVSGARVFQAWDSTLPMVRTLEVQSLGKVYRTVSCHDAIPYLFEFSPISMDSLGLHSTQISNLNN